MGGYRTSDKDVGGIAIEADRAEFKRRRKSLLKRDTPSQTVPLSAIVSVATEETKPLGNKVFVVATAAGPTRVRMPSKHANAAETELRNLLLGA